MRKAFYNNEVVDTPILNDKKEPVSMPRLYGNLQQATNSIVVSPLQDIQKAIDAIYALGGGTVKLQSGTYLPKNDIILKENCRLVGDGSASTIIDFNTQAYSLILPGIDDPITSDNAVVDGLTVKKSTTHGVIAHNEINNLSLTDVTSNSNGGDGFNLTTLQGGVLHRCDANFNTGNGFAIVGGDSVGINECSAAVNTQSGLLMSSSCSSMRIYGFLSQANTLDGITVTTSCQYCTFYAPVLVSSVRYGISLNAVNWINVLDARIAGNQSDGVRIDADANRNRIISATIISNLGWGVLINNANCDKNLLSFCDLGSTANTSGTLSDGGTGTVSVNHIT